MRLNYQHKIISILLLPILSIALATNGSLSFSDAWVQEAPPNANVMAAYMTIYNPTLQPIKLVRASSDMFSAIEFHRTIIKQDRAYMIKQDALTITKTLKLERGSYHLMLISPKQSLRVGDTVTITFYSEQGNAYPLVIAVKK